MMSEEAKMENWYNYCNAVFDLITCGIQTHTLLVGLEL